MNDEIDHLLFEDESMIRDYQAIQKTWFLRGKQRIIRTTGKHRGVKLLATVDYSTGKIVWQEDEQYTAETFLSFLQKVIAHYPNGKIVIVLDNARIQRKVKIVRGRGGVVKATSFEKKFFLAIGYSGLFISIYSLIRKIYIDDFSVILLIPIILSIVYIIAFHRMISKQK